MAVTNIATGTDTISFDVTRPGTPILVKVSYFPNWGVSGAQGPWRVGPNLMVVVPTSNHVLMHFGMTTVDWSGWLITILGLVGLVLLWRAGPIAMPDAMPWRRPRPGVTDESHEEQGEQLEPPISPLGDTPNASEPQSSEPQWE
jgi:hypothetical protein